MALPNARHVRSASIGLEDTYGVVFGSFKPLDIGGPLTVAALDSGAIDVGLLFSTSSVISANGWVVLEDDKQLQQRGQHRTGGP